MKKFPAKGGMCARIEGKEPQVQTTSTKSRHSKRSSGHNLMFAVSLHAASRLALGRTLSEVEEKVLAGFCMVCEDDDQEGAYYGLCFQRVKEQSRSMNEKTIFPAFILGLDSEEPYTNQQLRKDIKRRGIEISTEVANQVVDLAEVVSGWSIDTKEYLEALTAADGLGATLLNGPEVHLSSRMESRSEEPVAVQICLKRLHLR